MTDPVSSLLDSYDRGTLSRRGLLGALLPLLAAAPAAQAATDTITIKTLNHVSLSVTDIEKSQRFYQDLFGNTIVSKQGTGINLAAGPASFFGLYKMGQLPPQIHHFCLGIDGTVETAAAVLEKHSVKPTIRDRDGVKELYFRDPDNVQVQLQSADYRG